MQLQHDFTIPQPIETVWSVLTDLRNVATALPGASIDDVEADGTHNGVLRLKLGSFVAQFRGSARYTEVDPDAHRVVLTGEGQSPQGRAGVRLEGRAEPAGPGATRVSLTSQVDLNGRIAQFGAAMAGDVARQVLDRFVVNLSALFESTGTEAVDPPPGGAPAGAPSSGRAQDDEPLDLGSVLVPTALRDPSVLVALLVAVVLGWLIGRRRSKPALTIDPAIWRSLTNVR